MKAYDMFQHDDLDIQYEFNGYSIGNVEFRKSADYHPDVKPNDWIACDSDNYEQFCETIESFLKGEL